MDSFHDEFDEFSWMCDRLKKKKLARRELRDIIRWINIEISKLFMKLREEERTIDWAPRLEKEYFKRLIKKNYRNFDELSDLESEIVELEYCIKNEFNLGYVFNL